MSAIGLVILAAGSSSRLGTPKQLLPYEGESLLRRAAEIALLSSCRPVVVVLGAAAEEIRPEIQELDVVPVENPNWAEGMSASLRVGLETAERIALDPLDAIVLMVCDQPLLTAAVLDRLVAEYRASACPIVASAYGGTTGVPALFDRSHFPELKGLTGAQGAKQLLRRYPDQTHTVPFPEGAIDIDTTADYARLDPHNAQE